jgi:hypothetical protein
MTPEELAESEGKPIALSWIDAAIPALRGYLERRALRGSPRRARE